MSHQPNRLIAFLYSLVPLAIAGGVLLVLIVVGGKAVQGYEMRQEARAIERRVDQLKHQNKDLTQKLDYYRSDEYVEKVAREELGLVRPNDVAVIIVPPDGSRSPFVSPTPPPTIPSAVTETEVPTWQKWLSVFIGKD